MVILTKDMAFPRIMPAPHGSAANLHLPEPQPDGTDPFKTYRSDTTYDVRHKDCINISLNKGRTTTQMPLPITPYGATPATGTPRHPGVRQGSAVKKTSSPHEKSILSAAIATLGKIGTARSEAFLDKLAGAKTSQAQAAREASENIKLRYAKQAT